MGSLPPGLNVGADYGLTALSAAQAEQALKLVLFILSPAGQQILAGYGFSAPTLRSGLPHHAAPLVTPCNSSDGVPCFHGVATG